MCFFVDSCLFFCAEAEASPPDRFEESLSFLKKHVMNVMLDENEDPEAYATQQAKNEEKAEAKAILKDNRSKWRLDLQDFMESNAMSWVITILLVMDIIRFFIDLMILEDIFGKKDPSRACFPSLLLE